MCLLDKGKTIGVAFNEIDEVKYPKIFHKDREITKGGLIKTWNGVLQDLTPIISWLRERKVYPYSYPACCYLATSTPSQLGKMWAFANKVRLLPR